MKTANCTQRGWNGLPVSRLMLVKKSPRVSPAEVPLVLREASTGQVVVMLPRVWAVAEQEVAAPAQVRPERFRPAAPDSRSGSRPQVEVAFYRKYSEAMLRRYVRMSMAAGRVPSLLGRELFRGHVTSYQVHNFEDIVVFCMDVEKCLARLGSGEKDLIARVGLQEYTQAEAAAVLGLSLRHVVKEYGAALDKLTRMFLAARMLEPLKSCQ